MVGELRRKDGAADYGLEGLFNEAELLLYVAEGRGDQLLQSRKSLVGDGSRAGVRVTECFNFCFEPSFQFGQFRVVL